MAFLAIYPFGFRPHMPMARYVYRNFTGNFTAYSLGQEPFVSYPMYKPPGTTIIPLPSSTALTPLLAKGPIYLFTDRPSFNALPADAQAQVIYSEFPLESLGYGEAGTRYLDAFDRFSHWAGFLKLPPLAWVTLYRVERATTRSEMPNSVSKCCSMVLTLATAAALAARDSVARSCASNRKIAAAASPASPVR